MTHRFVLIVLLLFFMLAGGTVATIASPGQVGPGGCTPTVQQHGCSVFMPANEHIALGGNNEDWRNPFTKLWFIPAGKDAFGQMYVGFDNYYPQGGMNDQGLFFDGLAVAPSIVPPETDLPDIADDVLSVVMASCADVQCVVDYFEAHDRTLLVGAQLFFGDAGGDAVIIEPVEMIRKSGPYLVSTNFYQSATPPGEEPCDRYKTAQAMLGAANGDYSVELFRQILDATHQEGDYPTQYSNIYDLRAGLMYLYLFHDFDQVVEINLADELALGVHEYDIAELFEESFEAKSFRDVRERDYQAFLKRNGYDPDVDMSGFEAYTGHYAIPAALIEAGIVNADYIDISMQDGLLHYDLPGDVALPMPLYPTSATEFIASSYDAGVILFTGSFLFDAEGRVSGLQGDFGATPIVFERMP